MLYERIRGKVFTFSPEELQKDLDWVINKIEEIGEQRVNELIQEAISVRKLAYKPYSKYPVGAAILGKSGKSYASCNAEAVTYTESDHAERSAITKAISEGEEKKSGRKFIEAVVVCHEGESGPCGGCRQRIIEHCDNALVIDVSPKGEIKKVASLKILLPYPFTPSHLES